MGSGRAAHGGFTLIESLVALLLAWFVVVMVLGVAARMRSAVAEMTRTADVLDAARVARHVLALELRVGLTSADAASVAADTLGLRAYRGVGVVCAVASGQQALVVVPEGVRGADPEKDSVRVIGSAGRERTLALVERRSGEACPPPGSDAAERWVLSGDPPEGAVLALFFERGSYHLQGGALRYRRGGSGRQPMTPEVLLTPSSRFEARGANVAAVLRFINRPDLERTVLSASGVGAWPPS